MNYKKLYGITLKSAKDLCKTKIGKLPRVGYYVTVKVESYALDVPVSNRNPLGKMPVTRHIQLINSGGKYILSQIIQPKS